MEGLKPQDVPFEEAVLYEFKEINILREFEDIYHLRRLSKLIDEGWNSPDKVKLVMTQLHKFIQANFARSKKQKDLFFVNTALNIILIMMLNGNVDQWIKSMGQHSDFIKCMNEVQRKYKGKHGKVSKEMFNSLLAFLKATRNSLLKASNSIHHQIAYKSTLSSEEINILLLYILTEPQDIYTQVVKKIFKTPRQKYLRPAISMIRIWEFINYMPEESDVLFLIVPTIRKMMTRKLYLDRVLYPLAYDYVKLCEGTANFFRVNKGQDYKDFFILMCKIYCNGFLNFTAGNEIRNLVKKLQSGIYVDTLDVTEKILQNLVEALNHRHIPENIIVLLTFFYKILKENAEQELKEGTLAEPKGSLEDFCIKILTNFFFLCYYFPTITSPQDMGLDPQGPMKDVLPNWMMAMQVIINTIKNTLFNQYNSVVGVTNKARMEQIMEKYHPLLIDRLTTLVNAKIDPTVRFSYSINVPDNVILDELETLKMEFSEIAIDYRQKLQDLDQTRMKQNTVLEIIEADDQFNLEQTDYYEYKRRSRRELFPLDVNSDQKEGEEGDDNQEEVQLTATQEIIDSSDDDNSSPKNSTQLNSGKEEDEEKDIREEIKSTGENGESTEEEHRQSVSNQSREGTSEDFKKEEKVDEIETKHELIGGGSEGERNVEHHLVDESKSNDEKNHEEVEHKEEENSEEKLEHHSDQAENVGEEKQEGVDQKEGENTEEKLELHHDQTENVEDEKREAIDQKKEEESAEKTKLEAHHDQLTNDEDEEHEDADHRKEKEVNPSEAIEEKNLQDHLLEEEEEEEKQSSQTGDREAKNSQQKSSEKSDHNLETTLTTQNQPSVEEEITKEEQQVIESDNKASDGRDMNDDQVVEKVKLDNKISPDSGENDGSVVVESDKSGQQKMSQSGDQGVDVVHGSQAGVEESNE